ncbi:hypothetical protein, partial [Escherichia coli]|uniref:hypothetical protein n=1 Tax=Escherichia coli TaxID=562 RepID=UPI003D76CE9C
VCRGLLEDGQLFIPFCLLAFETCNPGGYVRLTFRGSLLKCAFIQTESSEGCNNAHAFRKQLVDA